MLSLHGHGGQHSRCKDSTPVRFTPVHYDAQVEVVPAAAVEVEMERAESGAPAEETRISRG